MPEALFPHHHWADADGLPAPDPQLAATDYYRNDPDTYSRNLQRWHQRLWNRTLADGTGLELTLEGRALRETASQLALTSDAAVPAWERWGEVQSNDQNLWMGPRPGDVKRRTFPRMIRSQHKF